MSATAPQADSPTPMSRRSEILLVAGRELRTQLLRKSALVSNAIMLVLLVGGIVGWSLYNSEADKPYRVGLSGADSQVAAALAPALSQVVTSKGQAVEVVDATPPTKQSLCTDAPANAPDLVLELGGDRPRIAVCETADPAVEAGVTAVLQQSALAQQVSALGGDPSSLATTLAAATPEVVALDPPSSDQEGFGARYAMLMAVDVLLLVTLMGGGQAIAMGVVEEKASRIVEILLACVRPTSLLAGKILGTGTAVLLSYGALAAVGLGTAKVMGVLPHVQVSLDAALVIMLVWMAVGFLTYAVLFGAAGSLVSRQEDMPSTTGPLVMLVMIPYMVSIYMALHNPEALLWQVLSYVPFFSPFLMPVRLVLGVSGWGEQALGLAVSVALLPVLVWVSARIYQRAVTRTGGKVPLREVLGRRSA